VPHSARTPRHSATGAVRARRECPPPCDDGRRRPRFAWQDLGAMPELTLGSFNLHMGRGADGHDAPFYDVVAAAKEIDSDVLALQEAWVPDEPWLLGPGNVAEIADALDYQVAATFAEARATCHDQVRLVAPDGTAGDGDWVVALLSRLPVRAAGVTRHGPQLRRDLARRALLTACVEVDGEPFTVATTHLPLLTNPVWKLRRAIRAALPPADHPAAFAGDMNMWGWCIDRLVPRGWRRSVSGRTYPAHRPHTQTDHILVTSVVDVVESVVVPQVMSDHRPIRARLHFG
jgi:endonuclease/exonuclease/phosphatase family metal-dependent hydrolase